MLIFTVNDISEVQIEEENTHTQHHRPNDAVSSLYLKQLPKSKIFSGSLLQLQETVGQGITDNYYMFHLLYNNIIKGEFGIVYRGLFTPDGNDINSAPIPVAIKTLKSKCYYL